MTHIRINVKTISVISIITRENCMFVWRFCCRPRLEVQLSHWACTWKASEAMRPRAGDVLRFREKEPGAHSRLSWLGRHRVAAVRPVINGGGWVWFIGCTNL